MIYLPLIGFVLLVAVVTGLPTGLFLHPPRLRRKPR